MFLILVGLHKTKKYANQQKKIFIMMIKSYYYIISVITNVNFTFYKK